MNTKRLWLLGVVCVLLDGAITYWAVANGIAFEANPNVQNWIQAFNLLVAVGMSVFIRLAVVAIGMMLERVHGGRVSYVPVLVMTPLLVAPVVWNVTLLLL